MVDAQAIDATGDLTLVGDHIGKGGRNAACVRWRAYLSNLRCGGRQMHFLVWDWRPNPVDSLASFFPWDAYLSCRRAHGDSLIVVIDSHQEGAGYTHDLAGVCGDLIASGQPADRILLFGNVREDDSVPVGWIDAEGGLDIGMHPLDDHTADGVTSHHFVMLARQPKPLRLLMASRVLSLGLDRFGHMSCGCIQDDIPWQQWSARYIDQRFAHRFPLLLDGFVGQDNIDQYKTADHRIKHAAINIICETSQDHGMDTSVDTWVKPWLTEKTTKAFLLCQLPLVVGVSGTVSRIRSLGLDMFDDVIDHSYDDEADPFLRVEMVCNQLRRLAEGYDAAVLRSDLWPRLAANRDILLERIGNRLAIQTHRLQTWLDGLAAR